MVWYSHLFKSFPQFVVIHTVRGFSRVNEAEVDVFLELLCFLHDPTNVGNSFSCSAASQEALAVKNLPANAGDIRDRVSIPGLGRSLE